MHRHHCPTAWLVRQAQQFEARAVVAGGDYIWLAKNNQPQLRADIARRAASELHVKVLECQDPDTSVRM
jgi:hypothetical protein